MCDGRFPGGQRSGLHRGVQIRSRSLRVVRRRRRTTVAHTGPSELLPGLGKRDVSVSRDSHSSRQGVARMPGPPIFELLSMS